MTPVATPTPAAAPPPSPGGRLTVADLLRQLGDVPADRVRVAPPPGQATLDDLIAANERKDGPVCEWVDGTLVEKAVGQFESVLATILITEFELYLRQNDIGLISAPDGLMCILPGIGRAPDVSFVSWGRLPGGRPPARSDKVPAVVPDLAVEVLSASNTPAEMGRKRAEYFRAGVTLVWEIDPETESATAYTGPDAAVPVPAGGVLDGGDVLPGFRLSLRAVFDRAARRGGAAR